MATTTTTLAGLVKWDQLTDPYDNAQLANNFTLIDQHDHTSGKGVQIPFAGIATGAIASSSDTSASKIVISSDTRLSDGRPPDYVDITWSTNADYTIVATKSSIIRQTGTLTAARTVTLPAANALNAGTEIIIQGGSSVTNTNVINISPKSGGDTINGSTSSISIGVAYGFRRFITDGVSAWIYDAGVLRASNNLSELTNTSTARTNLGLGSLATLSAVPDDSVAGGTTGAGVQIKANTITNANISTSAGIVDTKLATISTAGKVSNSALAGSGVVTIGSTGIALGASATTITGLSLSDSTTYIVDSTDNTKKVNIDVTGTTGITGTLQTAFTTAKTIAFPDTAGTVVTTGDSATVSSTMLSTTGVSAGTYDKVTVDTKGRVTVGANIGYGSTLPSSPSAGDEYYYVADSTNGVVWHLRYKDSTNKWEFVGGAPLASSQNTGTSSTLTSATYVYDLTTIDGPSVAIPLPGIYRMEFGFDVSISANNQTAVMGLHTSSTANTDLISGAELSVEPINSGRTVTSAKFIHYYPFATSGTIYAQFKTSGGTATVTNRWIALTPSKLG